jgi:hypothetical protein
MRALHWACAQGIAIEQDYESPPWCEALLSRPQAAARKTNLDAKVTTPDRWMLIRAAEAIKSFR